MLFLRSLTRPVVTGVLLSGALLVGFSMALEAQQQPEPSAFSRLPFEQWIREGSKKQIPWQTSTRYGGLSDVQRLGGSIHIEIGASPLLKRPLNGQLIALVQVTDSSGHHFRDLKKEDLSKLKERLSKTKAPEEEFRSLRFRWGLFILPGEYRVTFVLYHSGTGEHNVAERKLKIRALNKDPLPEAWRNLPAVEFRQDNDRDTGRRLYLPLETQRPVRIEILADLAPSDEFRGSNREYYAYQRAAGQMLTAFSQIEVRNGSMDIAALDLARQRVIFQQEGVKELDLAKLRKVLADFDAGIVPVDALGAKHLGPVLFRDELLRRINIPGNGAEPPLRVFILISSPLWRYSFSSLKSGLLPEKCSCVVYYLQCDASGRSPEIFSAIGNVKRMLRPLPVHAFTVRSPQGVRQALAEILREVSETAQGPEAQR